MRFFRSVWANGRTEAESQLNATENIAALAAGPWRENVDGELETISPPSNTPPSNPPRGPGVRLSTRLGGLHTGDEVHEYLRDERWTSSCPPRVMTTWPVDSAFSTGQFCPDVVTIATDDKDSVGRALERSLNRSRNDFGNAWRNHEQQGVDDWRKWVGKYTVKHTTRGDDDEEIEEIESCPAASQALVDSDESEVGEGDDDDEEEVPSQSLGSPMEEEDQPAEATDEERPGTSGNDSSELSESLDNLPSSLALPPAPPAMGGDSDIHTSDEEPSSSKKTPAINRKRTRVSDEGVDARRSRIRPTDPEQSSGAPFTSAQRITRSISSMHNQTPPNPAVRARNASTNSKRKGKGKAIEN
jgi:hypothetical protein